MSKKPKKKQKKKRTYPDPKRTPLTKQEELLCHIREPKNIWERYCSHVPAPEDFLVISALLLVFFGCFLLLMVIKSRPLQMERLVKVETAFVGYTEDKNGQVDLQSDRYPGEFGLIVDEKEPNDTLIAACGTGDVYTVYADYHKDVDTYDIAVLLAPDGTELVSLKESNAELRRLSGIVLTISAALFVLLCAALLGDLFTGANPERHPYLVTIFFARKPIFY